MGLPYSTVLALDSNTIAEFPELALVVIPDYLACPLCGPDGLLEIVEVPDADLAPSRRAARAEREQRLAKAEEARRNRRARGRPRRNLAEQG
ncbi:MAG TPA: hypothetical protein VNL77_13905 [Roseiflexaceae bacterium]|nr:hypothetical protein [Roseiflexaceae bacterium]